MDELSRHAIEGEILVKDGFAQSNLIEDNLKKSRRKSPNEDALRNCNFSKLQAENPVRLLLPVGQ